MSDKDYIKDLFSEKLGNYEAKVNPELWNSIASQIGTVGTAAASTAAVGMSAVAKWMIGIGIASAVAITAIVVSNSETEAPTTPSPTQNETTVEQNDASVTNSTSQQTATSGDVQDNQDVIVDRADSERALEQDLNAQRIQEVLPVFPLTNNNNGAVRGQEEPILRMMTERNPVHTKDPIVYEPMLPEVLPEEVLQVEREQDKQFSIGSLPNVFTPNRDGANDHFEIESENLTDFRVVVINSKNAVVFESNDPNFSWDGRSQSGEEVEEGNYVYFVTAKEFGTEKPKRYSPLLIKR